MPRNRILYNTLGLFVTKSPATGFCFSSGNSGVNLVSQLQRIQSVTDDWSIERTDINQIGDLGEIDRVSLTPPTVNLSYDWIVADVANEQKMGLDISGTNSTIRFILDGTNDDKNFLMAVAPEGTDIRNYAGSSQVFQFTNAYLTSYSVNGAVGSPVTATANYECLNWATSTGSIQVPLKAIDPTGGQVIQNVEFTIPVGVSGISNTVSALRPEGITVDIGNGALGLSVSDLKIQSFDFGFELPRTNLTKLGSFFPYSKQPTFPTSATASITAYVGDLTESELQNLLCEDPNYDITINLKDPTCGGTGDISVKYILKKAKLDSQSFSDQAVGGTAATVTLSYSNQVSNQTDRGAFISGSRF